MTELGLRGEERINFRLRELYAQHGYTQYRMSKFEEYDLYASNRDYLPGDGMITFTDADGRLMALKPDVTLSIVRNTRGTATRKLWYTENVYRTDRHSHAFREILQTGLECIGTVDAFNLGEVIQLAAESLRIISGDSILVLGDLDVLSCLMDRTEADEGLRHRMLDCISRRSLHELNTLLPAEIGEERRRALEALNGLLSLQGEAEETLAYLRSIACPDWILDRISALVSRLRAEGLTDAIRFDFSLTGNMHYYNGTVFRGYINGIAGEVLSGGEYDRLMEKMKRQMHAVGFAVYLDQLERVDSETYDTDILLTYGPEDPADTVADIVRSLLKTGNRVLAVTEVPEGLKVRQKAAVNGKGVTFL